MRLARYNRPTRTRGDGSIAVRDWEELTRLVREQILPAAGNDGACGMRRLQIGRMYVPDEVDAEWNAGTSGNSARLQQGAGSDLRPPLSGSRGYSACSSTV